MSLQGLISGAECAVPFNPLSQVLKHTEGDRSIQQDRVAGPSSSRLHHLPGTAASAATQHEIALARQFFEENSQASRVGPSFARPQVPPPEMAMHMPPNASVDLNGAWKGAREQDFIPASADLQSRPGWATEFGHTPRTHTPVAASQSAQMNGMQRPAYMANTMPYGMASMPMGMYSNMNMDPSATQLSDKGKGKSREFDFDAALAHFDQSLGPSAQESARIEEWDDTADLAAAMENTSLEGQGDILGTDFKSVWDNLQQSGIPPPSDDIAKWEAEYNQLMNSQREDPAFDYAATMEEAWRDGIVDDESNAIKFDEEGLPILGNYVFERDNKYMDPSSSSRSYLEDAKLLLEQGGSLTEVALMLEAAIQQNDTGEKGYEAWILLGEVRSMDEREELAMRALTEGVNRALQTEWYAGEGMLSLAISFTNESFERASHTMLLRWLRERYRNFPIPNEAWKSLLGSAWASHEQVTDAYIRLAQEQHAEGKLDPDLQIGLGVLFYTNGQFERAKDCFEAALSVRPTDYLLWNRLGSCLSNGNKPEEALGAYREALQIRPTYTRAIYNVGVACLNIGAHQEAAEHFLSALAMQDSSSGGAKSEQVWFTLRRTFLAMNRNDLADIAKAGTDVNEFRSKGFDF